MYVKRISLKNVRSHTEATFDLEPGLVLFLGPNGVGKTSILMGLAWALFDHLPMKQADFIQYGAKEAQVQVEFHHRSVWGVNRSTAGVYELFKEGFPVAVGKRDVMAYLRDVLGLVPGTSLPAFYGDAIGVPQGQLTAGLVLSPTARVDYWGKVLGLDSYRRAWKELLAPRSLLDMRLAGAEVKLAGFGSSLEVLLDGLPAGSSESLRETLRTLREQRETLERGVHEADVQYEQVQGAMMEWEAQSAQLANVRRDLPGELETLEESRGCVRGLRIELLAAQERTGERGTRELKNDLREIEKALMDAQTSLERAKAIHVHLHVRVTEQGTALLEAPGLQTTLVDARLQVVALEQAQSEVIADLAREASASLVASSVQTGTCPVCDTTLTDEEVAHITKVWEDSKPDKDKLLLEREGLGKALQRKRVEIVAILSKLEAAPSPRGLRELQEDLALKRKEIEGLLSEVSNLIAQQKQLQMVLGQQRDLETRVASLGDKVQWEATTLSHQETRVVTLRKQEKELAESMGQPPDLESMKEARAERESLRGKLRETDADLVRLEDQVRRCEQAEGLQSQMREVEIKKDKSSQALAILKQCRQAISDVGPVVSRQAMAQLSRLLSRYWAAMGKGEPVTWAGDYALSVGGREFRQLSGGEQVASAVAARMAVAQWLANLEFLILDEPTVHLDEESRAGLVEALSLLPLEQVLVVSHDDTFSTAASQVIQLT